MRRTLYFAVLVALPFAFAAHSANAAPSSPSTVSAGFAFSTDLVEVKGGKGRGHAFGRGAGYKVGWSRGGGRKVGWRGRSCPPGLWKQGRC